MSTIKSSESNLILEADGSGNDIKFQANGVEKASISSSGAFTSTTIDATKLTGTIPNFTSTGIDDNADATAITINSSEQVGIGQTSPSAQLHLKQTSGDQFLKMEGATTNWGWRNQSDGTHGLYDFTNSRWLYLGNNSYWSVQTGGSEKFKIMSDGRGLSQFTAKAWVTFRQHSTLTVSDSHNLSSVTDIGTGNFRLNFSNNMGSTNYTWTGFCTYWGSGYNDASNLEQDNNDTNGGTGQYNDKLTLHTMSNLNSTTTSIIQDMKVINVVIFGD